ncbi:hypothetical protein [Azospirillum endophyticum]
MVAMADHELLADRFKAVPELPSGFLPANWCKGGICYAWGGYTQSNEHQVNFAQAGS